MVYLIPIFLCLFFSLQYDRIDGLCTLDESLGSKRSYYFIFIWLVAISALQYCVGFDIPIYMNAYEKSKFMTWNDIFGDERYRPGWQLLQLACHRISNDFVVLKIIQAIFLNFCVYKFFSRYSKYWYLTLFFYILYSYGQLNFGAMRQSFAVGFFLLSIPYLEERDTKKEKILALFKYFGFIYIASLFHTSAFILYLFPLLKYCVATARRMSWTIFIIIIASIILTQFSGLNLLLFTLLGPSDIVEQNASYYLTSGDYEKTKQGFALVMAFIPITFIYLCLFLNKYKQDSRDTVLQMLLLAYIIMATLNLSIPIFYRFNDYFVFAYIVLIPQSIYEGELGSSRIVQSSIAKIVLFILFILYPVNHLVAVHPAFGMPGYRIYYPYYSVFDPQVDPDRNIIIEY